jgi:uncharacterized RDD family membrane protein YckC
MSSEIPDATQQPRRLVSATNLLRLGSAVLVVLSFVVLHVFDVREVGDTLQSKDGNSTVSAGSHPAILLWSGIAIVLFAALMLRGGNVVTVRISGIGRRVAAFVIDFWFSLLTLSSIMALIPLLFEASRTGHFAWHFRRDYTVATDGLFVVPSVLLYVGLMFLYFAFPLTRGKQTLGCFILGIRVTLPFGDEGRFTFRDALKRTFYEFRGLGGILSRNWGQDSYGRTWCDRETNCSVVVIDDA